MFSSVVWERSLHFYPNSTGWTLFNQIRYYNECFRLCSPLQSETLHKVSVNTPKASPQMCTHFPFEPTWLSCRNCFRGIDIFMFVDFFHVWGHRGGVGVHVSAACFMPWRITLGIFSYRAHWCEFTRSDCLNGSSTRKTNTFLQHRRSIEMDTTRCRQRRDDSFKTNNLHRHVTKMGAKTFFLRKRRWDHVCGILGLFTATFFGKASARPRPSLCWLSSEVSWHSGSLLNLFFKHSGMVLKNPFASSSDFHATDGAILSRKYLAKIWAREVGATFLTAHFDHSRVSVTLSLVSQSSDRVAFATLKWKISANDFDKRTAIQSCHLEGSINKRQRDKMASRWKTISSCPAADKRRLGLSEEIAR